MEEQKVIQPLSQKQKMMVLYLANGFTAKQIAEISGVKVLTIKTRLTRIKKKIGAKSAAHCVAITMHRGEISMNDALDTPLNQRPNGVNGDQQNER